MQFSKCFFITSSLIITIAFTGCGELEISNTDDNKSMLNQAPVALVRGDMSYTSGENVSLNASASYDNDGDALSFSWSQVSGAAVTLYDTSSSLLEFIAPEVTEASSLVFDLTVSDGINTDTKRFTISITPAAQDVPLSEAASSSSEASSSSSADTTTYNLGATSQETIDACMDSVDKEMLTLINNARSQARTCGSTAYAAVAAVSWNCLLEDAARGHSQSMADNNYFSHTGIDGSSSGDRITAAGYTWYTYGENIAAGYPDAESVMQGWLESEGHCSNIMTDAFLEVGVGIAKGGDYGTYWTQDFGASR